MTRNACELEIDLLCHGMRVPSDAALAGARGMSRIGTGLGSGLEIAIPAAPLPKREIWVNVPVTESFTRDSPYHLTGGPDAWVIADDRDGSRYPMRLPEEPPWSAWLTSRDVPMGQIGRLQGTYLEIDVNPVCAFRDASPRESCRFCAARSHAGAAPFAPAVDDVVEACWAAKEQSGITFVNLSGGPHATRGLDFVAPYLDAIKKDVGLLVGVELPPERDLANYDAIIARGVDRLSFCVELGDPAWLAAICPGKARTQGQSVCFDAMAYCASRLPRGAVSGAIIAGLEPAPRTLEAIDAIAALGALPAVSIFHPTIGSDVARWPSPRYEEMRAVMGHLYQTCRHHWLPLGAAPNIEDSTRVGADEAALLVERGAGFYSFEMYRWLARLAGAPAFGLRMRPQ